MEHFSIFKPFSSLSVATLSLGLLLAQTACASPNQNNTKPEVILASKSERAPLTGQKKLTSQQKFNQWKADFIQRAIAKGHDRALVQSLIGPAVLNPRALASSKKQPEFSKPIWSYVDGAASAGRIANGKAQLAAYPTLFSKIEARYHVDPSVLTAIWGLESAYGKIIGDHNIINALASFAYDGRRMQFGEDQLMAIIQMVERGDIRPNQLIGSWAGAMGMTQFIPTTFRDYAVDFHKDGNKDLWKSEGDALGSTAHYLKRHGWRIQEPIVVEVQLPDNFRFGKTVDTKRSIRQWKALDVKPINGKNWSTEAGRLEATLLVPAGANGPILLTFNNFDVIKKYNNSTSYALGITALSAAFNGQKLLSKDWPRADQQISRTQKMAMQRALTAQGYDTKGVDGRVGPNTRAAIRAWQMTHGVPADGYVEARLYARIKAGK